MHSRKRNLPKYTSLSSGFFQFPKKLEKYDAPIKKPEIGNIVMSFHFKEASMPIISQHVYDILQGVFGLNKQDAFSLVKSAVGTSDGASVFSSWPEILETKLQQLHKEIEAREMRDGSDAFLSDVSFSVENA